MPYKNNRNEIKKSEFERVNNKENKGVYKVWVDRYEMTKDGYVMYGKNNQKIGIITPENKITIFPEYKKKIEQVEGISLDSKEIVIEDAENIKEQQRHERDIQHERNMQEREQQKINEEQNKQREEKARLERSTSTRIMHQDLMENPKYKNVTSWTRIDDSKFIEAINPSTKDGTQIDKNSIIVAEVDGKFKILAKTLGTNEIVDLTEDAREYNTFKSKVETMDKNAEEETGRHCTIRIPMIENKEIIINKTSTGRIDLQQIDTSPGNDNKALPIRTDYMHPTEEELNRAKVEQDGTYNPNAVMTLEEVEKEVDPKILEYSKKQKDADEMNSIRDEVIEYAKKENPTENILDEKVKNEVEEFEKTEEDDEIEIEEEKEEKQQEEEDWLYGMSSRRRPRM